MDRISGNCFKQGHEALGELVEVCRNKTGQSYKIRGLLYSLWNGKPYSLLEIVSIDLKLRHDLLIVLACFGADNFFYDEIKDAFVKRDLFDWFVEEGGVA